MVKTASNAKTRTSKPTTSGRLIPAGEFKATCLKLLDSLGEGELIITKRGIPVARLVPYQPAPDVVLSSLISSQGDLVSPIGDDWDID